MAGEHYVEKAVSLMKAHYASYLPAELDAVETERSLTAGALTEPVEYLDYYAPGDNRSPLLSVFDDGPVTTDDGHRIYNVPVTVVFGYHSDADLSAAAAFVRQYQTALIRTVRKRANHDVLVGNGAAASLDRMLSREAYGDQSSTRHTVALGWNVLVDEDEC